MGAGCATGCHVPQGCPRACGGRQVNGAWAQATRLAMLQAGRGRAWQRARSDAGAPAETPQGKMPLLLLPDGTAIPESEVGPV